MFINIDKAPFKMGKFLGKASAPILQNRISMMKKNQKEKRIPESLMQARANDLKRIFKTAIPHWLDEVEGMAKGAGIDVDDILKINCLPPDFYLATGNNCTSFINIEKDHNMLFKIRDERNHIQQFMSYPSVTGNNIQIGRDIGNLGAAHAFSTDAVAFANNTGSETNLVDDTPRLNDCHILRYFVENVKKVDDVPNVFESLADKGFAGGAGKKRGCIFLFVDREKGLILETAADNYSSTWIEHGTTIISNHFISAQATKWDAKTPSKNTLLRKKRMEELLLKCNNSPSLHDVFAISRDRKNLPHALCNDDKKHFWMTISAQYQVINKTAPELSKNYICCGNTRHSSFLPFPIDFNKNFKPLVNGEFYQAANDLYKKYACSNQSSSLFKKFEKQIRQREDYENIYSEAYNLYKRI